MAQRKDYEALVRKALLSFNITPDYCGTTKIRENLIQRYPNMSQDKSVIDLLCKIFESKKHGYKLTLGNIPFETLETALGVVVREYRFSLGSYSTQGVNWCGYTTYCRAEAMREDLIRQHERTTKYFQGILQDGSIIAVLNRSFSGVETIDLQTYMSYLTYWCKTTPEFIFAQRGGYQLILTTHHLCDSYLEVANNIVFAVKDVSGLNVTYHVVQRLPQLRELLYKPYQGK